MRVQKRRWGEVTIKKQGEGKNKFDVTKSFSIEQTTTNYTLEEYKDILMFITNLTEKKNYKELRKILSKITKDNFI